MEHIFSLLVIGAVIVAMSGLFLIGEGIMLLLDKLFPNLEDKFVDFFCR